MSKDYFNDDADLTQIFPMPGGNKWDIEQQLRNEQQQRHPINEPEPTEISISKKYDLDASRSLLDASSDLLVLIAHLSNSLEAEDPADLKQRVTQEVEHFIAKTKRLNLDEKTISDSTYILCTAVDEAVLNTPWGRKSQWSVNTLLSSFFQDVSGGQVFFEKMRVYAEDPVKNYQILKLMYYCLALGYQGRYRTEEDAQGKLSQVRQWLVEKLRHSGADVTNDLSPHWIGVLGLKFSLKDFLSNWVLLGVSALLLAAAFAYFLMQLNVSSGKVSEDLGALDIPTVERPAPQNIYIPPAPKEPSISEQLSDTGFEVNEESGKTTLVIPGDILFASGSVLVTDELVAALTDLGSVLNTQSGQIMVTGHSDNVPLSFGLKQRYGSNMGLSLQRAKSVAAVLDKVLADKQRIDTYGKGAQAPLSKNTTAEGRAKNRRVEIDILH